LESNSLFMLHKLKEEITSLISNFFIDYKLLFYILLVIHLIFVCIGIDHSICDIHGFRQTQTAITSYYFIKEGFDINYMTPVVGYPWRIPFEFPVYQLIVAFISKVTHLDLDITGRIVSILAFYGCIGFVLKFKNIIKGFPSYLSACLMLCHPIYIFWSRTFLIESTALLLTISFVYFTLLYLEKGGWKLFVVLFVIGVAGIITKVTTFLLGIGFVCLYLLYTFKNKRELIQQSKSKLLYLGLLYISIATALIAWTKHCDRIKNESYIGSHLTSIKLNNWNFGTFTQRLEIQNWSDLFYHSGYTLFLSFIILIAILVSSSNRKKNSMAIIWMLTGIAGTLIFFNLYAVHNYYHYANTIFILIGMAHFIARIDDAKKRRDWVLGLVAFSFWIYHISYSQTQKINNGFFKELGTFVEKNSSPEDVVMIVGNDWGAEIAYYSHRKCITVPNWMLDSLKNAPMKFVRELKTPNIKHLLLTQDNKNDHSKNYVKQLSPILGLNTVFVDDKNKSVMLSLKPQQ
jgi:hypothetical protein